MAKSKSSKGRHGAPVPKPCITKTGPRNLRPDQKLSTLARKFAGKAARYGAKPQYA